MNFTEYFYENWLDKVISIVGVIVGVLSAVGISLSKIKEAIKNFRASSELVVKKGDELQNANQSQKALNADVLKLYEEVQGLMKTCVEIVTEQQYQKEEFQNELMKIQKALLIAFTNNSELVKKGQAVEINNVIGVKDEKVEA